MGWVVARLQARRGWVHRRRPLPTPAPHLRVHVGEHRALVVLHVPHGELPQPLERLVDGAGACGRAAERGVERGVRGAHGGGGRAPRSASGRQAAAPRRQPCAPSQRRTGAQVAALLWPGMGGRRRGRRQQQAGARAVPHHTCTHIHACSRCATCQPKLHGAGWLAAAHLGQAVVHGVRPQPGVAVGGGGGGEGLGDGGVVEEACGGGGWGVQQWRVGGALLGGGGRERCWGVASGSVQGCARRSANGPAALSAGRTGRLPPSHTQACPAGAPFCCRIWRCSGVCIRKGARKPCSSGRKGSQEAGQGWARRWSASTP